MSLSTLFEQAQEFLSQFFSESNLPGMERRLDEVQAEIMRSGTYRLTEEELSFGAKLAWRNRTAAWAGFFGNP